MQSFDTRNSFPLTRQSRCWLRGASPLWIPVVNFPFKARLSYTGLKWLRRDRKRSIALLQPFSPELFGGIANFALELIIRLWWNYRRLCGTEFESRKVDDIHFLFDTVWLMKWTKTLARLAKMTDVANTLRSTSRIEHLLTPMGIIG